MFQNIRSHLHQWKQPFKLLAPLFIIIFRTVFCERKPRFTMESRLHDRTFTNPGLSNSTFVAPWLSSDLYDLFSENILYCKAFERVVLIMLPGNSWRQNMEGNVTALDYLQVRSESGKYINCTFYDLLGLNFWDWSLMYSVRIYTVDLFLLFLFTRHSDVYYTRSFFFNSQFA